MLAWRYAPKHPHPFWDAPINWTAFLKMACWLAAGLLSGFAWYGILKLAQMGLRALGVNV